MIKKPIKNTLPMLKSSKRLTTTAIDRVDSVVTKATSEIDSYINPLRTSVLKRFPILFSLLTTFGVAATFLGFEKIVQAVPLFDQYPIIMLILGISILALTGTLYKKLS